MKKRNKFLVIATIGVISFAILITINISLYKTERPLTEVENITLNVDYNNGTIKQKFNFTLKGGKTTAFDALDKWCDIEYEEFSWGIIVRVIDGIQGSWIYKVNSYSPGVGAAVYPLNDGDLVEWILIN